MQTLPSIDLTLEQARAHTRGGQLMVDTGTIQRIWDWTPAGFATSELRHHASGQVWRHKAGGCDWQLPDSSQPSDARLLSLKAVVQDDEGFTREHICVEAQIAYASSGRAVKLVIWAYPGVSGLRTQLWVASRAGGTATQRDKRQGGAPAARVDRLPVGDSPSRRRLIGYYNATQLRNDTHQHILKEEVITHRLRGAEWCDWASALCVENDRGGFALVKESHKCVNQSGHATGGFVCDESQGVSCTGWGMRPDEIAGEAFVPGWATWCLAWAGGDLDRELAFKTFDRTRYPIDPARDIYIQSNTWGSTDNGEDARRAACEPSVLKELECCAQLGVDVLQIDDGWQVPPGNPVWDPRENGWRPHPQSYPEGWSRVRDRAKELGVKLGLWFAATPVGLDELKATYTEGGFVQYKLDFADLRSRDQIDELMNKVRTFIKWTNHRIRVNWDVTENPPRYGYFFAREYGCIYLENRKPAVPQTVVYRPHTVLRDLWQVGKYLNLHRFQCSIQNVDSVTHERSDAHLHSHAYAVAIALMGIPLIFTETKYYGDQAKAEIRSLLATYKQHREAIYRGIVHPIGDKPDNAGWAGFQCHLAEENRGYLTLFRERCNEQTQRSIAMGWLPPGVIQITDLVEQRQWEAQVGADGAVSFEIDLAPGFRFLHYTIEGDAKP